MTDDVDTEQILAALDAELEPTGWIRPNAEATYYWEILVDLVRTTFGRFDPGVAEYVWPDGPPTGKAEDYLHLALVTENCFARLQEYALEKGWPGVRVWLNVITVHPGFFVQVDYDPAVGRPLLAQEA